MANIPQIVIDEALIALEAGFSLELIAQENGVSYDDLVSVVDSGTYPENQLPLKNELFHLLLNGHAEKITSVDDNGLGYLLAGAKLGRIYSYYNNEYKLIFDGEDPEDNPKALILNIEQDVHLASIGKKLYIINCKPEVIETTIVVAPEVIEEDETPNADKTIVVTYPNGGETLEIGQAISILWSSTRGVNESIKIELYKGDNSILTITNGTSNKGSYDWTVPDLIEEGENYKIYLEWRSAGGATELDKDLSDNSFSFVEEIITTTTTTTTVLDDFIPSTDNCRAIPILSLEDDYITTMELDPHYGGVLLGTKLGRILHLSDVSINAFYTGNLEIQADAVSGQGFSNSASTSITYALNNKIAEVTSDKEISTWNYAEGFSAEKTENVVGIFLGPVLYVPGDLGLWKELSWTETKPTDTEIIISIRSGVSPESLQSSEWKYSFSSTELESGTITRNLSEDNIIDKYLQVKAEMSTDVNDITPTIADINVSYFTKEALYFYSNKFSLENNADAKNGLLTANITQPKNTEVKFGINNTGSDDWNDYQIITPNKFFSLNDWENIKVGIKLISYAENIPDVCEFAVIVGADKLKELN
mgnify:CR=1 FL=1|tara:strand:- start:12316 stop:14091 length:1776 start_codon:yes stop_codon:yes gene_type:complete